MWACAAANDAEIVVNCSNERYKAQPGTITEQCVHLALLCCRERSFAFLYNFLTLYGFQRAECLH
jgi:hypothetical protein